MEKTDKTQTAGESPRGAAEDVTNVAREQSKAVFEQARRSGYGIMDDQRRVFASYANHWASAMHSAASQLEKEGDASSKYAHWAADGLDRFSQNLSSGGSEDLVERATDFARRRPAIFFGGAVIAGIALSQLLKPSHPTTEKRSSEGKWASEVAESPPRGVETGGGEIYPGAEAEYGELETRKPGAPHH